MKICCFFISLICFSIQSQIKLEAFDVDGNQTNQAAIGQPFVLEVTIEGAQSSQIHPEIKGLEKCYVRNNGLFVTTINGRTTMKHKYRVRVDTPGIYTIGPAQANLNGTMLTSNNVSVKVSDQPMVGNR